MEDTSSKAMVAFDGAGLIGVLWRMRKSLPTWHLWLSQNQSLRVEFNKSEFDLATCKRDRNSSKNLDKLIGSQISDNNRKGVGYNVVPPPPTGLFAPPTINLSSSGLKEFQQPEFEG
ncbi:hypothetical protein Tco_0225518 [Tanacetum coccineum]